MKRICILSISAVLLLLLSSCGSDDNVQRDPDPLLKYYPAGLDKANDYSVHRTHLFIDDENQLFAMHDTISECDKLGFKLILKDNRPDYTWTSPATVPLFEELPVNGYSHEMCKDHSWGPLNQNAGGFLNNTLKTIHIYHIIKDTTDVTDQFEIFYEDAEKVVESGYKDYYGPDAYRAKFPSHISTGKYEPYALIKKSIKEFNITGRPYIGIAIALHPIDDNAEYNGTLLFDITFSDVDGVNEKTCRKELKPGEMYSKMQ